MQIVLKTLILSLFVIPGIAQSSWNSIEVSEVTNYKSGDREIHPTEFAAFTLDLKEIKATLSHAPDEKTAHAKKKGAIIMVPHPNGSQRAFRVWEAEVMGKKLLNKYKEIRSYKGVSMDKNKTVIRFSMGKLGFHGAYETDQGKVYIDPVYLDNPTAYQVYFIKNQVAPSNYNPKCGYLDEMAEEFVSNGPSYSSTKSSGVIPLRTYRFALGCTGEYGVIAGGTVEDVLERFNIAMTRLNEVFESHISARMVLIDDTDKLIWVNPDDDPYIQANMGLSLLTQNNGVFNSIIPSNSYDIGHLFTRSCTDVGGVASGANACQFNKAGGISCIGNANTSSFAAGTMAHEVGHQLSASHSWSNCPGNMEQLATGWAYEPGSGTTIMSYSGACGAVNNTGDDDDYYSVGSIDQMIFQTRGGPADCGEHIEIGNNEPIIDLDYVNGFYIPLRTPFELDASAVDPDGDIMTYTWDQFNLGPTSNLGSPIGDSPSFRSIRPTTNTKRTFPRLPAILGGFAENTEVLPTEDRNLHFRFVVRDNNPQGGAVVWEEVRFKAAENTGPFFVTSPNFDPDDVVVGEEIEVTWDVARTDLPPVNCSRVNILLSTDNGLNFTKVLASNTLNDGSEIVTIPNAITKVARVRVEAAENIFFDISNQFFQINPPTEPTYFYELSNSYFELCAPDMVDLNIEASAFLGYSDDISFSIDGALPSGISAVFSEEVIAPDGNTSLSFDIGEDAITGEYDIMIKSISGLDTIVQPVTLNIVATNFNDLALIGPESGSNGVAQLPDFTWTPAQNASAYIFELSSNPAFGETNLITETVSSNSFTPEFALEKSTLYYWKVTPFNSCGMGESTEFYTLGTLALSCKELLADDLPKNITSGPPSDVFSNISIFDEGEVTAITVENVRGDHAKLSNLTFSLISPSGTEVILVSNECFNAQDFNCGFDDASPSEITCPFNLNYKPEEPLAAFIGEPIMGDWRLNINDATAGNGGVFENFELQICSNATLDAPYIVNNNTLEVPTGLAARLNTDVLLTEDNNNSSEELIYTIISLPTEGRMEFDGEDVEIGTQFTQKDLNFTKVKYFNTNEDATSDSFTFTVVDGEGGWIDITAFDIFIGPDVVSGVEDLASFLEVELRPNPTSDISHISIQNTFGNEYQMTLINTSGQVILNDTYTGDQNIAIDMSSYPAGIYMINLESEGFVKNLKLSLVK